MVRHRYLLVELLLIATAVLGTAVVYMHVPARVPIHWTLKGQPNGYGPRWILFVIGPGLMASIVLVGYATLWLSPGEFSVENFRASFDRMLLILVCLMGYLNFAIVWSVVRSGRSDPGQLVIGGLCFFSVLLGNRLAKVRRNFFIGIRTPWTLANERVWNATHRFAAKTIVVMGLAGFAMVFVGWGSLALKVIVAAYLIPVLYSLVYYKKLERLGEL